MTLPIPGSKLTSTTITFLWQHGVDAQAYFLYIGGTPGGSEYLAANVGYSTRSQSAVRRTRAR